MFSDKVGHGTIIAYSPIDTPNMVRHPYVVQFDKGYVLQVTPYEVSVPGCVA